MEREISKSTLISSVQPVTGSLRGITRESHKKEQDIQGQNLALTERLFQHELENLQIQRWIRTLGSEMEEMQAGPRVPQETANRSGLAGTGGTQIRH